MTKPAYTIEYVHASTSATYSPQEIETFTEVDQGNFEIGNSPMISDGFYNCVALIGLSKTAGVLGHFQRIDIPDRGGHQKFGEALQTLAKTEAHTVILAGAHLFDRPIDLECATRDRAFAEEAVRAALPDSDLVLSWNEEYKGRQDIIVHPTSGKIVIHNTTSSFEIGR